MNFASVAILLIFGIYTLLSWMILGPFESISATWYAWRSRNYSSAFNIFGVLALGACICQSFYPYKQMTVMFFILSGACMWLLTVASVYKQFGPHHIVPTMLSIIFGYLAVWSEFGFSLTFYLSLGVGALGAAVMQKMPYRTTFRELWVVLCIITPFLWVSVNI